jgi:S1-C subfamily serine protease/tetratricopeptide (TPR) repeat protein
MKMSLTASKSIALTLVWAALVSYGAATPGQKGGRTPRRSVSKAVGLAEEADKLADARKYTEAIEAYKLAILLDPNYAPAHGGLGDAYLNSGTWQQALAEYKEQVRVAPNDAQAHFDLGYLYNVMGRHGEAFAPLVKAIALDPKFAEAFYEIGYAYLRGTDFDKSIPFLRSAAKLKPDYGYAYYGLGQAHARLGKRDLANEQLKKLKSLDLKLARQLEREIPLASGAADEGRIASEPTSQSIGPETQPSTPVATRRARVVTETASAEKAQLRNSSPAEPSTSRQAITGENASRQSESVRKRQKQRGVSSTLPAPNSQAQANEIRARPESANLRNRERSGSVSSQGPPKPISDGDWTEIIRQTMPGVVSILMYNEKGQQQGSGSGFVVGSDGIVVTNFHVIQGVSAAQVITKQGDKFDVSGAIMYDRVKDFAILKIPAFDLPVIQLGNSNNIELGENVLAIGDPKGVFTGTVSSGIISTKARELDGSTWIQTSTPVSHGNSGGPLLNQRAEAVGVISRGRNFDGQNFNFAVPINYVRGALQLGTQIKYSLPELAKTEAALERAAFEMTYAKYSDPGGIFSLAVLKEWRIQHARRALDNGVTADETVFAPQSAALAEIGGYLSEGMRVTVLLPASGSYFTPEVIETFKNQVPELALRGNPGFEVSNSGMFIINGLQAKVYTIDGKGQKLPEPERNVSYVFGNQKAIVQIDVVEPVSQLAHLDRLTQLAKSFEFNAGFAGSAGAALGNPATASGSQPTNEVTLRDLELSFRSNLFDETIRNATRFLQTMPNSPQAHAYLGLSLLVKKDVDNAVLHLEQSVLLDEPITLPVKRLREPLLGHGLDEATVTLTRDTVIIRSGKSLFQAGFSALSESRMGNYNNSCPIAFLKGQFLDGSNNKGKTSEKGFNLFPPSASLRPVQQGTLVYNVAACNDEGSVTTAIIKLLYRLRANTR